MIIQIMGELCIKLQLSVLYGILNIQRQGNNLIFDSTLNISALNHIVIHLLVLHLYKNILIYKYKNLFVEIFVYFCVVVERYVNFCSAMVSCCYSAHDFHQVTDFRGLIFSTLFNIGIYCNQTIKACYIHFTIVIPTKFNTLVIYIKK